MIEFNHEGTRYAIIPGMVYVAVSQDGKVLNHTRKGWRRRICVINRGYVQTVIKRKTLRINRAILMAWDRLPKSGEEAMHMNGLRGDNRLKNLQWGTKTENERMKVLHGKDNQGERNPKAILTEREVRQIRAMQDVPIRYRAQFLQKSYSAVYQAAIGRTWSWMI